jgi:hypothetical protein
MRFGIFGVTAPSPPARASVQNGMVARKIFSLHGSNLSDGGLCRVATNIISRL